MDISSYAATRAKNRSSKFDLRLIDVFSFSFVFLFFLGSIPDSEGITNPKCGSNYNVVRGQAASFFCRPSLYGRYLTIRITKTIVEALMLCEVEVYSARRGMVHVNLKFTHGQGPCLFRYKKE